MDDEQYINILMGNDMDAAQRNQGFLSLKA
jgi:hypothetical protein